MNYSTVLLKVIKPPQQHFSQTENLIPVTEFVGKFYQRKSNNYTICKVSIYGNFAAQVLEYYNLNDYVIVEGHIRLNESNFIDLNLKSNIEIIACKTYPYALHLTKRNK
jgi:hypothetical protein